MIHFFVTGTPKPQPRPRAFHRRGHARVYDPGTAEGWKGLIAAAARDHKPATPMCAACVRLSFWFPRPKGHFGSGKNAAILKGTAPARHCQSCDLDNLAKSVLDCLTTLGFWTDDSCVDNLDLRKGWGQSGLSGVDIYIQETVNA